MYFSEWRKDGNEGRGIDGMYILWGVRGTEFCSQMPFLSPTIAKDIHYISSFLQPSTPEERDITASILLLICIVVIEFNDTRFVLH